MMMLMMSCGGYLVRIYVGYVGCLFVGIYVGFVGCYGGDRHVRRVPNSRLHGYRYRAQFRHPLLGPLILEEDNRVDDYRRNDESDIESGVKVYEIDSLPLEVQIKISKHHKKCEQ